MKQSIGLVEFKSITKGIVTADEMIKGAVVELLQAMALCPGKYVVIVSGGLSEVQSAIDTAKKFAIENIIDDFVIGNVDGQIFPAISGATQIKNKNALGLIETFTAASCIEAADAAVKSAMVELIEIRLARGMGGKCFAIMTGNIGDVTAAVEAGAKLAASQGLLVNKDTIANPHSDLWEKIL